MSDQPPSHTPRAVVRSQLDRRRRLSLIWAIPIVSALIGAWLAWRTFEERGPLITISFESASGLTAGQSHVRHKDVDMGLVEKIALSKDLQRVVVTVRMNREATPLLTDKAQFWIVKPRFFAGALSGLETLVSGSYIELQPSAAGGQPVTHFTGLETPPVLTSDVPGHTFLLTASRLGNITLGSPVFYRDLDAGEVLGTLARLRQHPALWPQLIYAWADEAVLLRRYTETRRRHPLPARGVEESIAVERRLLQPVRERADLRVDTGDLNSNQLRLRILEAFGDEDAPQMQTSVISFGYKHGIPLDVDLVFDCRFLPNPFWVEELRPFSGLDEPVRDFVLGQPESIGFLEKVDDLLTSILPAFVREGKSYLTVAMGCTGGRHRSVVLAHALAERLGEHGLTVSVFHRDIDR